MYLMMNRIIEIYPFLLHISKNIGLFEFKDNYENIKISW